jgi:hypothetical protein
MVIYASLLVALVGALVYALSANPKFSEMGRLAFACGLLAFLVGFAGQGVRLFGKG